jgi:hypothetical protein
MFFSQPFNARSNFYPVQIEVFILYNGDYYGFFYVSTVKRLTGGYILRFVRYKKTTLDFNIS